MYINEIKELPNKRRQVIFDDESRLTLYAGEIRKYGMKTGEEVPEDVMDEIIKEVLPKRAKLRCLNLLKSRPYTEQRLREKLNEGGYPSIIIDDTIEYLRGLKLINDIEYARNYFRCKSSSKSIRQIMNELMIKGISKSEIDIALTEADEYDELATEDEAIERLIVKRHYDRQTADYEQKQKMRAYLFSKGFRMDDIYRCT